MSIRSFTLSMLAIASAFVLTSRVQASPTQVVHSDTPQCDFLFIPFDVEEIGHFAEFPANESLDAFDMGPTPFIPCPPSNISLLPEMLVEIRNLSGRAWNEVWYVADRETSITNFDGEANEFPFLPVQEAFRLDHIVSDPGGSHHPLVFESMTFDGIWEVGETWQFVLQDYTNTFGLPASAITSIGVGDGSKMPASGLVDSSGSIIGIPRLIPEPGSLALALLGVGAITATRRRR